MRETVTSPRDEEGVRVLKEESCVTSVTPAVVSVSQHLGYPVVPGSHLAQRHQPVAESEHPGLADVLVGKVRKHARTESVRVFTNFRDEMSVRRACFYFFPNPLLPTLCH